MSLYKETNKRCCFHHTTADRFIQTLKVIWKGFILQFSNYLYEKELKKMMKTHVKKTLKYLKLNYFFLNINFSKYIQVYY